MFLAVRLPTPDNASYKDDLPMTAPRMLLIACLVASAIAIAAAPVRALDSEGLKTSVVTGAFEDVFSDLQDAIIAKGVVIDFVGHVDTMLTRTSEAAGSVTEKGAKSPFLNAKYVQFCSAKLTHEAVSASPFNIAVCPYVVFVFETAAEPGKVVVGYRKPITGPSKRSKKAVAGIEALLDDIVKDVTAQ